MSADLLQRLAEAGTPMSLIMEVAETLADAKAAERLLEKRRAKDRDRKRENPRISTEPLENAETVETPAPLSPPKVSPAPPTNTPPISPTPRAQAPILVKGIGLPDFIPKEPWMAFVRMRKSIPKVPFTEDAARGAIRKVEKLAGEGYCPAKLLWKAVDQGWRGVFAHDDCKVTVLPIQRDAAWHEDQARFYEKIGKADDAAEHRKRAMSIGQLIGRVA